VQELKHELASALAEGRAVVEEVVLLQASPELEVEELAGRPAGSREGVGRQLSGEEGREGLDSLPSSTSSSRKVSAELGARSRAPAATPRTSRGEGGGRREWCSSSLAGGAGTGGRTGRRVGGETGPGKEEGGEERGASSGTEIFGSAAPPPQHLAGEGVTYICCRSSALLYSTVHTPV
jgi:hypothetical protein